jgi:hypothetical protein
MRKAIKIVVIGFIGLSIIVAIAESGSKSTKTQPTSVAPAVTSHALTIGDLPAKATAECNSPTYAGELGGRAMPKPNGQRDSTEECETDYIQNSEMSIQDATNGHGCIEQSMPEGVKLCEATQAKRAPVAAPTAPAPTAQTEEAEAILKHREVVQKANHLEAEANEEGSSE